MEEKPTVDNLSSCISTTIKQKTTNIKYKKCQLVATFNDKLIEESIQLI